MAPPAFIGVFETRLPNRLTESLGAAYDPSPLPG